MQRQRNRVKSWGKPLVPAEHADEIEIMLAKHKTFKESLATQWYKVGENGGFTVYAPAAASDVKELRCYAEGTLACSMKVALELINDAQLLKTLDPNVEKINVVSQDAHNSVKHVTMKGMYFTAPREVVTVDHWRVDPATGCVLKTGFSITREDIPEHPDPSVKVRAKTRGWTVLTPDEHDENKVHISTQVDIDVRLDHVPAWVQRTVGGTAQKVNAQNFASNMKTVNGIAKKKQLATAAQHVLVNHDGELHPVIDQVEGEKVHIEVVPSDFADLRVVDAMIALLVVMTYSSALFFPNGLLS